MQELAYGCLVGSHLRHQPVHDPEVGLSVPVSKLPELVYETKKEIAEAGLLGSVLGHVGDGEFSSISVADSAPAKPH